MCEWTVRTAVVFRRRTAQLPAEIGVAVDLALPMEISAPLCFSVFNFANFADHRPMKL
jgi:hypothetical protein